MRIVSVQPKIVVLVLFVCALLSSDCLAQAYKLGFYPGAASPDGVRIQSVIAGGPLTKMKSNTGQLITAESGDVIVAINGQPTLNVVALKTALGNVGNANGVVNISLRNWRNGLIENYLANASFNIGANVTYVGLSEAAAVNLAAQNNLKTIVVSRDGVPILTTAVYVADRVKFEIMNGVVVKAFRG